MGISCGLDVGIDVGLGMVEYVLPGLPGLIAMVSVIVRLFFLSRNVLILFLRRLKLTWRLLSLLFVILLLDGLIFLFVLC